MIDRHKLFLADAVLRAVSKLSKGHKFILESYSNGREHGYALLNAKKKYPHSIIKVVFAESRSSYDIMVVCGKEQDFNIVGNVPAKNKRAKSFPPDSAENAAKFIVEYLTKE
jgi:hypothetical protein